MLQEMFPSFQTKMLVNSYCLSDPLKVFQLKNRHWTILNNEFLMHKKIFKVRMKDTREKKSISCCCVLTPHITKPHSSSIK